MEEYDKPDGLYAKIPISIIKPASYNPRKDLKDGDPEYEALKRSIELSGLVDPVVWNKRTGNLVGGHQRLKVLIDKGEEYVDASIIDVDERHEKILNIQLNKIQGTWDQAKLKDLLNDLDTGFDDLTVTGFTQAELDVLLESVPEFDMEDADAIPHLDEIEDKEEITCPFCGKTFQKGLLFGKP
jgi:ParB-like chromosome segregation protein Spo0J